MSGSTASWSSRAIVAAVAVVVLLVLFGFGFNAFSLLAFVAYVAFWAAIIGAGVWLAYRLLNSDGVKLPGTQDAAISELRKRYARGEISRAEYFQMKQDLEAR